MVKQISFLRKASLIADQLCIATKVRFELKLTDAAARMDVRYGLRASYFKCASNQAQASFVAFDNQGSS